MSRENEISLSQWGVRVNQVQVKSGSTKLENNTTSRFIIFVIL